MSPEALPPPARLWRLMRGPLTVQAVRVAAELGLASELDDGPQPVSELARRTGADADTLGRFLRALASDGVFAEDSPGVFRNTDASELLRRGSEWAAFAHFFGGAWYDASRESLRAVRTGDETFSLMTGEDWWSWLAARPPDAALFNRAMQGGAENRADVFAELVRDGETVADIGGGNGTLLIELLRRRESLRGIVFDLPEIVAEARERVAEAGLDARCGIVAGSFFDGVPAGADVYILKSILHDWDDERAAAILGSVRAAAREGTRVLIGETVIAPGNDPDEAKWLDLLMLVLNRGRERSEDEWRALLGRTGFEIVRLDDVIEARCR